MSNTKQCRRCGQTKPISEFHRRKLEKDGLHYNCKACCKVVQAKTFVQKRDKKSKVSRRQEYRAHLLGAEVSEQRITLDTVYSHYNGVCAICGKYVQPSQASLDHIHPLSKGGTHTWNNIQLAHIKCNKQKGAKIPQ